MWDNYITSCSACFGKRDLITLQEKKLNGIETAFRGKCLDVGRFETVGHEENLCKEERINFSLFHR
jgi:hypothetical protein